MQNKYRIRYSNVKNTLVTTQDGDYVYFGIARCNMRVGDRFNKKHGTMVALSRAEKAQDKLAFELDSKSSASTNFLPFWSTNTYWFAESNLYGVVHVTRVRELLNDFEAIDEICRAAG
jgi:hypothetical protein